MYFWITAIIANSQVKENDISRISNFEANSNISIDIRYDKFLFCFDFIIDKFTNKF